MQEGAVTDPGPPQGGDANSKGGCEKLLFGIFSPNNCMKLKDFGPRAEGGGSLALPWTCRSIFWTISGKMYSWNHWFGH